MKVDQSTIVTTDIVCDNGVIHVIDAVMIPQKKEAAAPAPPAFKPKEQPGVSGPFGFFDPLGLCPQDEKNFKKYRESELDRKSVV